jgi:hypothetical protein
MTDHKMIQDLFEVYLSGEASKETKKTVEEHLAECAACRKAFEQAQAAEEALHSLEEVEKPTNGKDFVARLRRVLYGVGVGILVLLTILLAILEYVAFEDILGIQVPRLDFYIPGEAAGGGSLLAVGGYIASIWLRNKQKGAPWMWTFLRVASLLFLGFAATAGISTLTYGAPVFIGILMLAIYLFLLDWRTKLPPGSSRAEFFHSLEAVIPLFAIGIGLGGAQALSTIIILSLILIFALSITLIRLPKLRYMSMATTLVMLATVVVLAGQTLSVVLNTLDGFPVIPSALGHPPAGADLAQFVDYRSNWVGMHLQSIIGVDEVGGVKIEDALQAQQGSYLVDQRDGRNAMVTSITVIEFDGVAAARQFIDAWNPCQPSTWECDHVVDLDMEETLLFEGRFLRVYDNDTALAQNAWQTLNWVTIIETEGTFIDAMPLNKEIREMIADRYRNEETKHVGSEWQVVPVGTPIEIFGEPTAINYSTATSTPITLGTTTVTPQMVNGTETPNP